jgi:hypothetical protein
MLQFSSVHKSVLKSHASFSDCYGKTFCYKAVSWESLVWRSSQYLWSLFWNNFSGYSASKYQPAGLFKIHLLGAGGPPPTFLFGSSANFIQVDFMRISMKVLGTYKDICMLERSENFELFVFWASMETMSTSQRLGRFSSMLSVILYKVMKVVLLSPRLFWHFYSFFAGCKICHWNAGASWIPSWCQFCYRTCQVIFLLWFLCAALFAC